MNLIRSILATLFLAAAVGAQTTQPIIIPPSTQPTTIIVPPTIIQMQPGPTPAPTTRMSIGTNVAANDPTTGVAMWADVTHQCTGWYKAGGATSITYDANGYPATVTGGFAAAWTYLYGYPTGNYALSWKGPQNALSIAGKTLANVASDGSGGFTAQVAFNGGDRVEFRSGGGISAVSLLAPDAVPGRTFRDVYLSKLSQYAVCRLMCLERVNGVGLPPVLHPLWSQRNTPTQWDQTTWEVALEYQAELCRESGCIPWICIGYGADDDTIARTAQVFVTFPIVYVQLSNELWNTAPAYQGNLIRSDAIAAGTYGSGDPNVAGARRHAELLARVGKIFRQTIGTSHVRVIYDGQATWNAWAANGFAYVPAGSFYALAVAPYFQPVGGDPVGTVPQVFASCDKWISQVLQPGLADNARVAQQYGAAYWTYEGGQHLIPSVKAPTIELQWQADLNAQQYAAYLNDPTRAAQVDPGIGIIYDHLLDTCRLNGVTLFTNFMLIGNWGRSGYWGLTQQTGEADGPKGMAIQRAINASK